jgi:hypothetical protein
VLLIVLIFSSILPFLISSIGPKCLLPYAEGIAAIAVFIVISSADLLFIRLHWGKAAGEKREKQARTKWGLAIITALLLSPVPCDLMAAIAFRLRVQPNPLITFFEIAGPLSGVGFFFFLSIFRDKPTRMKGILAYGCLTVFLSSVYLLFSLRHLSQP